MSLRSEQTVAQEPVSARSARHIDDIDRRIVAALVADGRMSFSELAETCHISRSTAHARVDRLRRLGAITGFGARVDAAVLGFGICALVFVKIHQHEWRAARDAIADVAGVESLMMCAGEYDLVCTVRCTNMSAFRDTLLVQLHAIDGVAGSSTAFVLDEVRRPFPT